jgi:NDP-sugar pyrophosphorylase family protein
MPMPDTLESIMAELRGRINTEDTNTAISKVEIEEAKARTVVVFPAGGRGTRIRAETQSEGINKVMIKIDGEVSMIEKAVRDYAACGIDKFVVLTGFLAEKVEEHLGDGSRWNVDIKYSEDPEGRKVGSGGAVLNALNNGALDGSLTAIVHNPDDLIVGLDRPYGEVFLEGHLKGRKNGCIGTLVVVPETPFQYSGVIIEKGLVRTIFKYPPIAVPAHTGITVFDPQVYDYFRRLVSLEVESSFESVVCPQLVREDRLFAINIPASTWIPVNNLKELEQAAAALRAFEKE